jgi:hypothetical protein
MSKVTIIKKGDTNQIPNPCPWAVDWPVDDKR